jgi:hypothetical protein
MSDDAQFAVPEQHRRGGRRTAPRKLTAGLALAAGLVLSACAVPFGPGADQQPAETNRERNRLYLEEQYRMERGRQLNWDGGPPPDH